MMKLHGKTYPVSPVKGYIHDDILKEIKILRKFYGFNNNIDALSSIAHGYFLNHLKMLEELKKEEAEEAPSEDNSSHQEHPKP